MRETREYRERFAMLARQVGARAGDLSSRERAGQPAVPRAWLWARSRSRPFREQR